MPIETKFERCDPLDPRRCKCQLNGGAQCPYLSIENGDRCPMHAAATNHLVIQEQSRNYRLTKWQQRLNEFADHDKVKSLREEIGILRILLEETMAKCNDADDLMMYSGKITDVVMKIEKVVSSCHRLEASTGLLIDKTAILSLGSAVVEIIVKYITDEAKIKLISDDIVTAILQVNAVTSQKQLSLEHA